MQACYKQDLITNILLLLEAPETPGLFMHSICTLDSCSSKQTSAKGQISSTEQTYISQFSGFIWKRKLTWKTNTRAQWGIWIFNQRLGTSSSSNQNLGNFYCSSLFGVAMLLLQWRCRRISEIWLTLFPFLYTFLGLHFKDWRTRGHYLDQSEVTMLHVTPTSFLLEWPYENNFRNYSTITVAHKSRYIKNSIPFQTLHPIQIKDLLEIKNSCWKYKN